jgi:chorismate synthase
MRLEKDEVEIISGVRGGKTLGTPVAMLVRNAEYNKWKDIMKIDGEVAGETMTSIRPGHADLAGALKYGTRDLRDILERASARGTVGRVCAGAAAKSLLGYLDISVVSHVLGVGEAVAERVSEPPGLEKIMKADSDPMRCLDKDLSKRMMEEIDLAGEQGDSLGGVFEVIAFGLPAGLGSHVHWDRRLDARLAAAVMGIQAIKGVEIGDGFDVAAARGSQVADMVYHQQEKGFYRRTNHAGGLEGGMTNGEPVVVRAAMKPIPTLTSPVESLDLVSKERLTAAVERADLCAVAAAAVIAESAVAFVIADALLEKTGGDSLAELEKRYKALLREQASF